MPIAQVDNCKPAGKSALSLQNHYCSHVADIPQTNQLEIVHPISWVVHCNCNIHAQFEPLSQPPQKFEVFDFHCSHPWNQLTWKGMLPDEHNTRHHDCHHGAVKMIVHQTPTRPERFKVFFQTQAMSPRMWTHQCPETTATVLVARQNIIFLVYGK